MFPILNIHNFLYPVIAELAWPTWAGLIEQPIQAVGGEASDALKLLEEEGTTAVLPEIVAELKDLLHDTTKLCRKNETGKPVQRKQADVEDTLALLINALRKTIERREGG